MNMVDIYVAEVGKNLPKKDRLDLEQEIRSLIEDAIDDAAEAQGRERDEALVVEVLKQFGRPEDVAASYSKPRYLIGPKVFPTYWLVLRIVLAVVLVVSAIALGLEIGQEAGAGQSPVEAVVGVFTGLFEGLLAVFANVTLVFVILERLLPEESWKEEEEFDPRKLQAEADPEQVSMFEPVFETAFILALLMILNIYPYWIGLWSNVDGRWAFAPVLAPAFFQYVPYINVLLGLGVGLNALLLQRGHWGHGLRWFQVTINLAEIALMTVMLFGPTLLQLAPGDLARLGWEPALVERLLNAGPALTTLFRSFLGLVIALNILDTGKHIYRIFFHKSGFSLPQTS